MGPSGRVAPNGTSREAAERLAPEIAAFLRACMLADRASAYGYWDLPLVEAFSEEGRRGAAIAAAEGEAGARRFTQGAGRDGRFET